jgi:signal transduction histidine kinase/ligand-binding sensor domain-containing protein
MKKDFRAVGLVSLQIWLFVACLWYPQQVSAGPRYLFRQYGAAEGLTNQVVTALLQDRAGFIWVGTENGLFRYDGWRFQEFTEADGLPHAYITTLHESSDGTLWVGTIKGIAWQREARFRASTNALLKGITPAHAIGSSGQSVFIGTLQGLGIITLPLGEGEPPIRVLPQPPGTADPFATTVLVLSPQSVWYGCGTSLCNLRPERTEVLGVGQGVPTERWQQILLDRSGNLWARSRDHLIERTSDAERFVTHRQEEVRPVYLSYPAIMEDSTGSIFVTTNRGLAIHSGGRWRTIGKRQGLPMNEISTVLQDREGSVWVGTVGAGLSRWLGYGNWESYTELEGLPSDQVWSLLADGFGGIWAGTSSGLAHGRPADPGWQWEVVPAAGVDGVRGLARAKDGAVWMVLFSNEIARLDPSTMAIRRFPLAAAPADVLVDSKQRLWVATAQGAFMGNTAPDRFHLDPVKLPETSGRRNTNEIIEDLEGGIWLSTFSGLFYLDDGEWKKVTVENGLRNNLVAGLVCAPNGDIWAAYRDPNGIAVLRPGREFSVINHFDRKSGLHSDRVYSVDFDPRGSSWILTDRGIDVRESTRIRHLSREDGLIWDDCNTNAFLSQPDGSVWIGTSRGLSHYLGRPDPKPTAPLPLVVTEAYLGESPLTPALGAELRGVADGVRVRFAVLSYLREQTMRFRYRLSGHETEWHETSDRDIKYLTLSPGRYALELQTGDEFGTWSPTTNLLVLRLDPRWYQSAIFRAGIAVFALLVASAAGSLIWQYRLRRSESARRELEIKVSERTAELKEANDALRQEIAAREKATREKEEAEDRLRHAQKMEAVGTLAAGVAHDYNNLLTSIIGYTELALTAVDGKNPARGWLGEVLAAGGEAASLTAQLLAFGRKQMLQLEILDLNQVIRDTEIMLRRLLGKRIRFGTDLDPKLGYVRADRSQMQQVLINLISNSRDALPDGGMVTIRTQVAKRPPDLVSSTPEHEAPAFALLQVIDNGTGMDEATAVRVFDPFFTTKEMGRGTGLGLSTVFGIIAQSGGEIRVQSAPHQGSTFTISLPCVQMAGSGDLHEA